MTDQQAEWQPIATAPQDASEVRLRSGNGECIGHWACDLSGSEQPPFRGWFRSVTDSAGKVLYFTGIAPEPTHWAPLSHKGASLK